MTQQNDLSDEQLIERCKAAGIGWLDGFPGMFDMATMSEMRALLSPAPEAREATEQEKKGGKEDNRG